MGTFLGSAVADANITTACDMTSVTGGTETSKQTNVSGTNAFFEITSQGKSIASVTAIPATPTGNGWTFTPGPGSFATGNWSITFGLQMGNATGGSSTITLRVFKWNSGTYTLEGSSVSSPAQAFVTTRAQISIPSVSITGFSTIASDQIYVDLWIDDNLGNLNDNPIIFEST